MKKGAVAIVSSILGVVSGIAGIGYFKNQQINQKTKKADKFKSYYNMLNRWFDLKQHGKSLEQYFLSHGYHSIAIYGMGEMGNRLYEELKGTVVEVKYAIDSNVASTYAEVDVLEIDETLEEVDAIIVSAIFAFDVIEAELSEKVSYPIISLEDVVYDL